MLKATYISPPAFRPNNDLLLIQHNFFLHRKCRVTVRQPMQLLRPFYWKRRATVPGARFVYGSGRPTGAVRLLTASLRIGTVATERGIRPSWGFGKETANSFGFWKRDTREKLELCEKDIRRSPAETFTEGRWCRVKN